MNKVNIRCVAFFFPHNFLEVGYRLGRGFL